MDEPMKRKNRSQTTYSEVRARFHQLVAQGVPMADAYLVARMF